jgi:hypothetical protein
MVTIPVELVPPVTAAGLKLRAVTEGGFITTGFTERLAITAVVPVVAVTVAMVRVLTVPVVTINVVLFVPAGTATLAGTGTAVVLLLIRPTLNPLGAFPLRVIVPVDAWPDLTDPGLKVRLVTTGAFTVTVPVAVPLSVAVIVTTVCAATGEEVTVKLAEVVAPPGTLAVAGTEAAAELELISATLIPAAGAGLDRVTMPVVFAPPVSRA